MMDCRLFSDLEKDLATAIGALPEPDVAVINTTSLGLGQASAVLDILKRVYPDIRTVLFGQHPSQFPRQTGAIPRMDFALAGDPEPILRSLLDWMNIEQRLRHIPGLIRAGDTATQSSWLDDLGNLSLPVWQDVFWGAYHNKTTGLPVSAQARLSRGHTRHPADRAAGCIDEPLRLWPFDKVAVAIQKSASHGVTEVFLDDPPGLWTVERLQQWCAALDKIHTYQPWGLQLLPILLTGDVVTLMKNVMCKRVEFIFPSCDPAVLSRYGCGFSIKEMSSTIDLLQKAGVRVHARFWIGGPEGKNDETGRVIHTIRALGYPVYSLHSFPFVLDSPIYREYSDSAAAHLDDWIKWARDPWIEERPIPLWDGQAAVAEITECFEAISGAIRRNPVRILKKALSHFRSKNWISVIEDKSAGRDLLVP
ncbi:MAG: hypothetical protein V1791_15160 [Pseudomonadota bacterium]